LCPASASLPRVLLVLLLDELHSVNNCGSRFSAMCGSAQSALFLSLFFFFILFFLIFVVCTARYFPLPRPEVETVPLRFSSHSLSALSLLLDFSFFSPSPRSRLADPLLLPRRYESSVPDICETFNGYLLRVICRSFSCPRQYDTFLPFTLYGTTSLEVVVFPFFYLRPCFCYLPRRRAVPFRVAL